MNEDPKKVHADNSGGKAPVRTFKPLVDVASESGRSLDSLLAMLDAGDLGAFVLMDTQRTARWSCRIPDPSRHPANEDRFADVNFEIRADRNGGEPIEVLYPFAIEGVTFVKVHLDRPAPFGPRHVPRRPPVASWRSLRTPSATLRPQRMEPVYTLARVQVEARSVTDAFMQWKFRTPSRISRSALFEAARGNPIGLTDIYIDPDELPATEPDQAGADVADQALEVGGESRPARRRGRKPATDELETRILAIADDVNGSALTEATRGRGEQSQAKLVEKIIARAKAQGKPIECGATHVLKLLRRAIAARNLRMRKTE